MVWISENKTFFLEGSYWFGTITRTENFKIHYNKLGIGTYSKFCKRFHWIKKIFTVTWLCFFKVAYALSRPCVAWLLYK